MTRGRGRRALVLAALLAGCAAEPRPINVVILGIDTLRADHLGCYGYARPTSPRMDGLAAAGVVFERAIAQSPWTLPSFASILTGVLPQRHGAGEGKLCLVRPCGALVPGRPLLSEIFRAAGYRTASFVSNGFAGARAGLGLGFEATSVHVAGAPAVEDALGWLGGHRDEPLFLFLHLVEPHMPYGPPTAGGPSFLDPAYEGPLGDRIDAASLKTVATDADRRRVIDLYDADVYTTDLLVGRVLDELVRLDLDERTLVVLVADHGEELYERGTIGHGHTLYDEVLHVPLVLRYPGGSPRGRVAAQVRAMDVFPTVLEAAGLPVPSDVDAVSLAGLAGGDAPPPATATAIAEFTFVAPERRGLRTDVEKLIVDVEHDRARLYDLVTDRGEFVDVAAHRPERVAALRRTLGESDAHTVPGLYVWARGGNRPQRVRLELRLPDGGVVGAATRAGEATDAVLVAPDGRSLTVALELDAGDTDGVHIELADPTTRFQLVAATLDDAPLLGVGLRAGAERHPVRRLPVDASMKRLAVPRTHPPSYRADDAMVVVEAVVPAERPRLELDAETAERLRALGYAE